MIKKKQLQQKIDELEERLQIKGKTDYVDVFGAQWVLGSSTRNFYASHFYDFKDEITDRLNKLEQYLNIEYKVTESKREEGYVKKEDVRLGITNGPFVSGPLIPLGKNTGKIMKK